MGLTFSNPFSRLFGQKHTRIVMVGLDGAGKTTILHKLELGEIVTTTPYIGFNVKSVENKNVTFTVWDAGGHAKFRKLWRYYFEKITQLQHDELRDSVLLVLANKQDLPGAMDTAELTDQLELNKLCGRRWYVQKTCGTQGNGLYEGLEWLSKELSK
ncbi:hypothetical protein CHUAL_004985 [Chamberlinius hualienensis]